MSEGGTLKTLSLSEHNGQARWGETVIYLDRIQYAREYPYEDYPDTCCIAYDNQGGNTYTLHIDISLTQMRQILGEHKRHPMKNFDTHCDASEMLQGVLEKSKIS